MKILLIYNLSSGRGKFVKSLSKVKQFFKTNNYNYDIYDTRLKDNLIDDVTKLAPNYDVLVIAGGDGTIHNVINGMMAVDINKRPRLLVLPFGTTNDYANMLGLGKDIDFNLALLKTKHYRLSDVYLLNDEYFVYATAAGKFTNISYNIDRRHLQRMGSLGYIFNTRKDLFKKYDLNIDVKTSKIHIKRKAFLIFIAAGSRVGGFNISKFSKSPKFNDGKIDVRIFTRNHIFSWMKLIWFYIFKGRHFHNDIHIHTDHISIELNENVVWNVDGEAGPKGDINIRVLSKQIEVYVHPKMIHKLY